MPDFRFDQSMTFTENCDRFLTELELHDAEMATILRANWDELLAVVQNGESDSRARTDFNSEIGIALDAMIQSSSEPEEG